MKASKNGFILPLIDLNLILVIIHISLSFKNRIAPPAFTEPDETTAALIIGGFSEFDEDNRIKQTTEIFGCDGENSIVLAPFPYKLASMAATYLNIVSCNRS